MKEGEKGVLFKLNRNAKLITAMYSKSTEEESGLPVYNHQSTITAHGADEMTKSILATLDLGRVVAVNKFETPTGNLYEVFGWTNGLTTGDYDYDITGSNGVVPITLESGEDFLESHVPYVFKSDSEGQEDLDFEDFFSPVFSQSFSTTYNLLISSENSLEVLMIYNFLKASFLSLHEHLELYGFQNLKMGGNDIQMQQDLVPTNIYHRSLTISFDYEMIIPSFYKTKLAKDFKLTGIILP